MNFFYTYFICPIIGKCPGYNIFNTTLYALVSIITVYLIYKYARKRYKFDMKFVYAVLPFVVLGSLIRVMVDANIYPYTFWTVTPGIWFVMLIFGLINIELGRKISKKDYWKISSLAPVIIILTILPNIALRNIFGGVLVLVFWSAFTIPFLWMYAIKKLDVYSLLAIAAQMFDASATFISIQFFGYVEKHVLPTFLINLLGPWAMFALKLAVVLPIIYIINKETKNSLARGLKITIMILGMATGIRDFIRLIMLV
ncbi:hypothetical protein DRN75_00500 [Nanoarchaeota archaeon]|nr:MAG: hypothetical protein DRN75_00500 [Nanoarchaeota archaeon]